MSTTRLWTEIKCGLQPLVVEHCESDSDLVRCSSVKMDRRLLLESAQKRQRHVEKITKMPTNKNKFVSCYGDIVRAQSETFDDTAAVAGRWNSQRLENILLRNVTNLGLNWVASVDCTSLKICLQLHQCCPLNPHVQIAIETGDDVAPRLKVTNALFWAREHDWLGLYDNVALLRIKEIFSSSYAQYEIFLKQINELDENAYMYSAGCEQADIDACVASSPTERTLFYPKPVVRKILLQLHHGEEITAVFTIRSQVDPQGGGCVVEAAIPSRAGLFVSKWKEREKYWSTALSVRRNIEAVLGVDLAAARAAMVDRSRQSIAKEVADGLGCAICFAHQATPTKKRKGDASTATPPGSASCEIIRTNSDVSSFVSCLNSKCDKLYHAECAMNWLTSLPSVKRSFGTLFGKCPYCGDVLEVKEQ